MAIEQGSVLRGYELQQLLGEGGFGAVYRAYQPAVKRNVALKIILPEFANQPEFIRSFESEAQLIARLEHLHVVPLYDFWRDPDGAYLVMRLMQGGSLRDLIKKGPLELSFTAKILDQIASALYAAHRQGIIHRDIKPDNILLDEDQNAYLTDFGISIDLNRDEDDEDDFDDTLTGSPHYISPEQAQQLKLSPRSDVYSLGIVLFEMLTGQAPFVGNTTMMELILKQINEPLPPLETFNPDLPPTLDLVIQQATDKNPDARYPNTLALAQAFRQAISLPANSFTAEAIEVEAPADDEAPIIDVITPSIDNPYKGLRPFEQADASDFFGRDALIEQLLTTLEKTRFLAVIGPSGSGKSSVVKAGLIPRLRKGALSNSEKWFIGEFVPSNDPFRELASVLLSCATERVSNLEYLLRASDSGLVEAANRILPDNDTELVLLIDQFEEVFTLVEDEATRTAFLASLLVAATSDESRVRIIITLRADFYDRPLLYAGFGELIRRHSEVVLPLGSAEIEQAIVGPAARVGCTVEPALVAAITTEIQDQPGALPLLQYALTEVFERREGSILTYTAYQASGGVLGALARRAEEIYQQLDAQKQNAVRQIFLRLVTLGEGTEDTRRRVEYSELLSIGDNQEIIQTVLDLYSRYRLLTFDNDPVTRNPTVEVAHEAILREWKRLREWLDESRDDVRSQQRLASAANIWKAENYDPSFLADGLRLQQFETLLQSGNITLTEDEKAYVQASIDEREKKAKAEAESIARERALEKRNRRISQIAAATFAIFSIIAGLSAVFALNQRSEAISARDVAEANFERAESERIQRATAQAQAEIERNNALRAAARSLASLSHEQLEVDPVASVNLALYAIQQVGDTLYVPEAERALADAVNHSQERVYVQPFNGETIAETAIQGERIAFIGSELAIGDTNLETITLLDELTTEESINALVDWSPNGQLLSVRGYQLVVWQDTQPQTSLEGEELIQCAQWSPDGSMIGICVGSQAIIWEPSTNTRFSIANPDIIDDPNQIFSSFDWTPDGRYAILHNTVRIIVWDKQTGQISYEIVPQYLANENDLTHEHMDNFHITVVDENRFLSWDNLGYIYLWSIADGKLLQDLTQDRVAINGVAFSPERNRAIIYQNEDIEHLWEVTGDGFIYQETLPYVFGASIVSVAWRDDTILAASAPNTNAIVILNANTGEVISTLLGHTNRVEKLHWLDTNRLLSVSQDGSARIWEVFHANGQPIGEGKLYEAQIAERGEVSAFWIDDNTIGISGQDGLARRIDLLSGTVTTLDDGSRIRWFLAWREDGTQVVRYSDRDQLIELWDFDTQTMLFSLNVPVEKVFWVKDTIIYSDTSGQMTWLDTEGSVLGTFAGLTTGINDIDYHAPTKQIAVASDDAKVYIYALPNSPTTVPISPSHVLNTEERIPVRVTWHSNGIYLASIGFNGDVILWNVTDNEQVFFATTGQRDFPGRAPIVFSPTEQYMAAAIDDEIIVYDLSGNVIFRTTAKNAVQGVDWVPHESRLRLVGWGLTNNVNVGFVGIWDIDPIGDEDALVWYSEATSPVVTAAPNSNGTQLLASGRNGRVSIFQIWPSLRALVEEATNCCQTRPLSPTQVDQFNIRN